MTLEADFIQFNLSNHFDVVVENEVHPFSESDS